MTVCFKLGGLRKSKMSALIEKIDKASECGALTMSSSFLGGQTTSAPYKSVSVRRTSTS